MSKRARLVVQSAVAALLGLLLQPTVAQAADKIPEGAEINPYGCLGRYETATKDRTTSQMETEVERKLDPLFQPEDPRSIRAMKACVVAMLKSRLGHSDAAEYYLMAINEQPFEPGYELWAGNYYSGFRGAHRPVLELAERHYYAALRKLEELDRQKKRRYYHDVVEDWVRKRMLLLYQEDGLHILPWKQFRQSSSGLDAPGLSIGVMAAASQDTRPFNRRGDFNEMRTFSGEANFANSVFRAGESSGSLTNRSGLGPGLKPIEYYWIPRADLRYEVDAKARLRQRYFGALDFRYFDATSKDAQITSFYYPAGTKPGVNTAEARNDVRVTEMGLEYQRVFPLYPLGDFRLAGGAGIGERVGVVEFLPDQHEDYKIYTVMPSYSHFVSTDKLTLDLTYTKLDFDDTPYGPPSDKQREKIIRAARLEYAFYSPMVLPNLGLFSLRPYRTPTRGIYVYAGFMQDDETYGTHTVSKQDIYGGVQYRAPVHFNYTLQGTYLTADDQFADANTGMVYTSPGLSFRGWRTSTYAEIRVIDPEALPTITGKVFSPDLLNIVIPVTHDLALGDSIDHYENIRAGIQAWFQVFGTGFGGPAFLFTAGYDFQYFYNISRSFHMFSVNARLGWGEL
ncbi:MAG TPA: hypothetical protein VM686_41070 [Polyangiaceae bacterium]|nr:hypothetical protein [Polyangiaceae bacterium]